MNKTLVVILRALMILIIVFGTSYSIWVIAEGDNLKTDVNLQGTILNPFFLGTFIILLIAIIGSMVFPLISLFSSKMAFLKTIILLAIFGVIYLVAWSMADGNIDAEFYKAFDIDEWTSRFYGTLINIVYILGLLSILTLIGSGIYNFVIKR